MVLEFIDFSKLESAWKAMEDNTVSPFMYYDYMAYIVRSEKKDPFSKVLIACIKDSSEGEILMIVPLCKRFSLKGSYYKMLGDLGGCDIAGPLYKSGLTEGEKSECIKFFYDSMKDQKMYLRRLLFNSPFYLEAPKDRIASEEKIGYVNIHVPTDFESYLMSLSGYSRHNVRRAYNRMERDGVNYRLEVYTKDNPIPSDVWKLLMKTYYARFHAKYKRGVFSDETKGGFIVQTLKYIHYRTIKKLWFYTKHDSKSIRELDNSRICVLWNGDEMIAFLCGFMTHDNVTYSLSRLAINEKYNYYTPGCILIAEVLKYLMTTGVTVNLDMSRGDEQYKFKMGGIEYFTYDILLK